MTLRNLELGLAFLILYGKIDVASKLAPLIEAAHNHHYSGIFWEFVKLGYSKCEALRLTKELWSSL